MNRLSNYFTAQKLAKQFLESAKTLADKGEIQKSLHMMRCAIHEQITATNNVASIAFNSKPKARKL